MKNYIAKTRKTIKAGLKLLPIVMILALLPTLSSVQAATSLMEGNVTSLNVTRGETQYKDSTDASVDEVVQVQLWQHNRNNPAGEKVSNTVAKFNVPKEQGKKQIVTGTASSDNGNTVTDTTDVNLSLDRARLNYIKGSAKFRYNKGAADGVQSCITGFDYPAASCYVTVPISDEVINGGVNLDTIRGGALTGCNAHHETVIIQVRVVADVVSVNKFVRHKGGDVKDWKTTIDALPGDQLEYMIRFKNEGNTVLNDVVVADNLPKYNKYTNGSTILINSNYPTGTPIASDNVAKGGINVGNYSPSAVGMVQFSVQLDGTTAYAKCGIYDTRNVGIVKPKDMIEYYNTAQVKINNKCDKKPSYTCESLTVVGLDNKKIKAIVKPGFSGNATVKSYTYDFGDGSKPFVSNEANATYTYAKDGTYKIVAKVDFVVDGKDKKDVTSQACESSMTFKDGKPVTPVAPITVLPSTGIGNVVATLIMATAAGAMTYSIVLNRTKKAAAKNTPSDPMAPQL